MIHVFLIYSAIGLLALWLDRGIRAIAKKEETLTVPDWHIPAWLDEAMAVLLAPLYIVVSVPLGAYLWFTDWLKEDEAA